tara:strand:- start:710 stop:1465 length:756 start_codon:yes stop_codon:yes gene_type:complete
MKKHLVVIALFISGLGFAQSINDYKAVIIPLKYEFMKSDNQYRLATLTKFNLEKAGFDAYYVNEEKPMGLGDRCGLLDLDVVNQKAFLTTKLYIVFKDCFGKIVYQSEIGLSREKSYDVAYSEAMNKAFESVIALEYKYNGNLNVADAAPRAQVASTTTYNQNVQPTVAVATTVVTVPSATVLYAQPTTNGFQLVDSTPSVVLKIQKTAKPDFFLAQKAETNGVMYKKDNQWVFEYYQGDTLMSEKVDVKF